MYITIYCGLNSVSLVEKIIAKMTEKFKYYAGVNLKFDDNSYCKIQTNICNRAKSAIVYIFCVIFTIKIGANFLLPYPGSCMGTLL